MRVGIFEPAVGKVGRPHHDEVVQAAAALRAEGAHVIVHAHQSITEDMTRRFASHDVELLPSFTRNDFDMKSGEHQSVQAWSEVIDTTTRDLAVLPEYDLAFWPAIMASQLQAIVAAPRGRRIVTGNDGQISGSNRFAGDMFASALPALDKLSDRFVMGYYDHRIVEFDRPIIGGRQVIALPLPFSGTPRIPQPPGAPPRVGIVGALRHERGKNVIGLLVRHMLDRGIAVVLQSSFERVDHFEPHPNLELLPYVEDFAALVASCDAIMLPSSIHNYVSRLSGVALVAMACGVPLVMPSRCLPAQIVAANGVAEFVHVDDAGYYLAAVETLLRNLPARQAEAERRAALWNATQGPAALARTLLALADPG